MNVLDFVMVGSDDHQKSGDFYDAVFEPLKLKRVLIGYRSKLNKKSLRKLTSTTLEHVAPSDIHFEMVIPSENA